MLKSYKTEIKPTNKQIVLIHKSMGVCRFLYNFYLDYNQKLYNKNNTTQKALLKLVEEKYPNVKMLKSYKDTPKEQEINDYRAYKTKLMNKIYNKYPTFISAIDFSKYLNNEFLPNNKEYSWIKEPNSKAVKESLRNAEGAYKNFFKGKSDFPKFKKKHQNKTKVYFVKNDDKHIIQCERHKIKVPKLGWISIKEKGYLPTANKKNQETLVIKSGTISYQAGRYYISITVDHFKVIPIDKCKSKTKGIGIDLGLKVFATLSNGLTYLNINKSNKIRKLEKRLKREQRKLSRKLENYKKIKKEGGNATRKNINKQNLKVQKVHQRLANIRTDYLNKIINEVVKTKPSFIVIEDLKIKQMLKNKYLSK